ncbi:MAG: hypothetical protein KGH64_06305, partial [Candidatus Micrarchaeota archaeon]|nr:hypothetical protein [Candidatus Micrarchaeota archaeon]
VEQSVGQSVGQSVRQSVEQSVWQSVRQSVPFKEGSLSYQDHYYGIGWDSWLSFYDYFRRIGILKGEVAENLDKYIAFAKAGIWTSTFFENMVFVCTLPTKIIKNERGRLHSLKEPAVQWKNGEEYFFINGVNFKKELWLRVSNKEITAKEAIQLENAEQRRAVIEIIGSEIILREMNAKLIEKVQIKIKDKQRSYELYEVEGLNDDERNPARYVKVPDFSTDRDYFLRVPYQEATRSCKGAVAWTFGIEEKDYAPQIES